MKYSYVLLRVISIVCILVRIVWPSTAVQAQTPDEQSNPIGACTLGMMYVGLNQYVDAQRLLESGVAHFEANPESQDQFAGMCMLWLGILRQSIGDWNGALEAYEPALEIFRKNNDAQLSWSMYYAISAIYMAQGQHKEAEKMLLEEALPLVQQEGEWFPSLLQTLAEIGTLNNLGATQLRQEKYDEAYESLLRARSLFETFPPSDTPSLDLTGANDPVDPALLLEFVQILENMLLGNTTDGDFGMGQFSDLLQLFVRLNLQQEHNSPSSDEESSQPTAQPLEDLFPVAPNADEEIDLLDILELFEGGGLFEPANEEEAPVDLEQLLALIELFEPAGEEDDSADAEQLLSLIELMNDPTELESQVGPDLLTGADGLVDSFVIGAAQAIEPIVVNNLGEVKRAQEDFAQAHVHYDEALAMVQSQLNTDTELASNLFFVYAEGATHNNKGLALYQQYTLEQEGDLQLALEQYDLAFERMQQIRQPAPEASVRLNRGALYTDLGQYELALDDYRTALELLEDIRLVGDTNLTAVAVDESAMATNVYALGGSLTQFVDVYNYAVQLSHKVAEDKTGTERDQLQQDAFAFAERSRARLFLDLLTTSQAELTDPELANLLREERHAAVMRQAMEMIYDQTQAMESTSAPLPPVDEQLELARNNHEQIISLIKDQNPQIAALLEDQGGVLSIQEVQELLDDQTTLVSYYTYDERILQEEQALAFVITKDTFDIVELPTTTAGLIKMQSKLSFWLSSQDKDEQPHPQVLQDLHQMLIAPLADVLTTEQVRIVPHQMMHYVPFSALTDGTSYISNQHTLFLLPSASTLRLVQENAAQKQSSDAPVALVFGDPAVDESYQKSALPLARTEALSIANLLSIDFYRDSEASEQQLRQRITEADIVHLAAHGVYNRNNPIDSALYLAGDPDSLPDSDGRLRVGEIFNLQLPNTTLVVLSACETNTRASIDPEREDRGLSKGDEVVSLTRAFFMAGSPSVLSTLWQVNDKETHDLMVAFYTYWQQDGMSKTEALRAAQEELQDAGVGPFYWGAFHLYGDSSMGNIGFEIVASPTPEPTPTTMPTPTVVETATSEAIAEVDPDTVDESSSSDDVSEVDTEEPASLASQGNGFCTLPFAITFLALVGLWGRRRAKEMEEQHI